MERFKILGALNKKMINILLSRHTPSGDGSGAYSIVAFNTS